ncbi:phage portal protein [Halosquirtibacter xylanolyticus]|uniref:phage portal protein n=1 Tax=Halosquirtibacter xylanolyticus TaxID=3374599 RepID=UPI003748B8A0|nr:phage portal protein [Prolixibacteraceae bacterium]
MSFFSGFTNIFSGAKRAVNYVVGADVQKIEENGVTDDPSRISTVFTCHSRLSEHFSRMPILIKKEEGSADVEDRNHRLFYLLRYAPNPLQNAQQFWSTIEYHRNQYGNGYAQVFRDKNSSYPTEIKIIHPLQIIEARIVKNGIIYKIQKENDSRSYTVHSNNILHFRGLSEDGLFGLSPLIALQKETRINERASSTIDNFYKNNATSPMALESELPGQLSGPAAKMIKEGKDEFKSNFTGPQNAGKIIHLPPHTKITKLAMQFADAQLLGTLKYTREEIAAAYGVPMYMIDGSAEKLDIEQMTLNFATNTMGPIAKIYKSEIERKLLTKKEIINGTHIEFDSSVLLEMDYTKKVRAVKEQVVNGLLTPEEGAKRLGNRPVSSKWAQYHYVQAQYIPLELYEQYNPLLKDKSKIKE